MSVKRLYKSQARKRRNGKAESMYSEKGLSKKAKGAKKVKKKQLAEKKKELETSRKN